MGSLPTVYEKRYASAMHARVEFAFNVYVEAGRNRQGRPYGYDEYVASATRPTYRVRVIPKKPT
jgi:hypothetical protein